LLLPHHCRQLHLPHHCHHRAPRPCQRHSHNLPFVSLRLLYNLVLPGIHHQTVVRPVNVNSNRVVSPFFFSYKAIPTKDHPSYKAIPLLRPDFRCTEVLFKWKSKKYQLLELLF
jgi:hypothetical protein